jgi:hypothetical protein
MAMVPINTPISHVMMVKRTCAKCVKVRSPGHEKIQVIGTVPISVDRMSVPRPCWRVIGFIQFDS